MNFGTQKPYYKEIQEPQEFLEHYLSLYQTFYERKRVSAITKLLPKVRNQKILDVGCGGGFYSFMVAKRGARDIVGIDLEEVCVRASRVNIFGNVNILIDGVVADSTNLPFSAENFDLVLCIDVIEHVEEDRKLIQELFRVLKPCGFLVISSQNSFSLNYLLEGFFQRIASRKKWMGWDPTHVRFYNPKSFFDLLRDFEILKVVGTYFVPYELLPLGLLREMIVKINELFETRCDRTPWNLCGWGVACLCKKSITTARASNRI